MGISLAWDNDEKTVLRFSMYDKWTWAEFDDRFKEACALIRVVDYPVSLICVLNGSWSGGLPLAQSRRTTGRMPVNVDKLIVVADNSFARTVLSVVTCAAGHQVQSARSLAEARTLLAAASPSTPTARSKSG